MKKRKCQPVRPGPPSLRVLIDRLDLDVHSLITIVRRLDVRTKELLMSNAESLALLKRMDVATTNIAADIRRLKDKTDDPEVKAGLEAQASRLEAMAADPENPDPEAPPAA